MRTRDLKPGFFQSDELAEVSRDARLLFAGLWTLADREGRIEFRPKKIKALLFPYDDDLTSELVESMVGALANARGKFVRVYEVEGNRYLEVTKFKENQHIHPNEKPSTIPAPGKEQPCQVITGQDRKLKNETGNYASSSEPSGSLSLPRSKADCAETAKPSSPPAAPVPALLTFPCDGKPGEWNLTQATVSEWGKLFPTLDIVDQCREALAWIVAQPNRRKTSSGMPRFLVNWFTRTKNNPPRVASALPSRTDYGGQPARVIPPARQPLPKITPTTGWTQKEKDMAKKVGALTSEIAKATEPQHEGTT